MTTAREKLLGQFRELLVERLEKIGRSLMQLESGPDADAGKQALRELHGLKGEARMMGFADINALVHEMEEVVRVTEPLAYGLSAASIDALLVASDAVTALSGAGEARAEAPDVPRLLEWLKQRVQAEQARVGGPGAEVAGPAPAATRPPPAATPGPARSPAAPPVPGLSPQPPAAGGTAGPRPSTPPLPPPSGPTPRPSAPPPASSPDGTPRTGRHDTRIEGVVRLTQQSLEVLTSTVNSLLQRNRRRELVAGRRLHLVKELQSLQRVAEDLGAAGAALAGRLGRAKDLAAELHRDQKLLANEELRDLTQLSEEVQAARMLPLGVLFEVYPRMVRDLARDLGKDVDLKVEGEDTRVDRSVLEALKDPLLHLVRNALDHGLEPRAEREVAGKPSKGRITLRARREGERLVISVADDGRGLDPRRLRAAAVRKGLLAAEDAERLTDAEAMDLIFLAGFSSRETVTDVSGRGVGLDAVRTRMAATGGEVTVDSTVGEGSTFTLRVPVSLTVAPLLFVEVGEERVCVAAANVGNVTKVTQDQLRQIAGRPALRFDDQVVPFTTLASILGAAPERGANEGDLVIVVHGRGQTAAVGVDRVIAERVQAVLPLRGLLSRYAHLSGATPLADGTLAFVLSAVHLVASAQGQPVRASALPRRAPEARRRRILVVDDSPLTRELLSSLLEAVGYEIVSAQDGADAMDRLGRETVDMVVTDLEMPNVDGLELTRRIKNHPALRSLPVVIVTTRGSDQDRKRGMEAGADGYITKGDLVRQDLVDVVSRLLA